MGVEGGGRSESGCVLVGGAGWTDEVCASVCRSMCGAVSLITPAGCGSTRERSAKCARHRYWPCPTTDSEPITRRPTGARLAAQLRPAKRRTQRTDPSDARPTAPPTRSEQPSSFGTSGSSVGACRPRTRLCVRPTTTHRRAFHVGRQCRCSRGQAYGICYHTATTSRFATMRRSLLVL